MDLCGPMRITSKGGKRYVLVVVDDYSHFTWTLFLASKYETFEKFFVFLKRTEKRVGHSLVYLRSDHGKEFQIRSLLIIVMSMVLIIIFLPQEHPQQNGVVEHKNRTLEHMTKTILIASGLPRNFWAEALNTSCSVSYTHLTLPTKRIV